MSQTNVVLFTDAAGDYTLADLCRAAKTWTDDPKQQTALVEAYLTGQGRFLPRRLKRVGDAHPTQAKSSA